MSELITIDGPGPLNPIGTPAIDWAKPVETVLGIPFHLDKIDMRCRNPIKGRLSGWVNAQGWKINGAWKERGKSILDLRNVQEVAK